MKELALDPIEPALTQPEHRIEVPDVVAHPEKARLDPAMLDGPARHADVAFQYLDPTPEGEKEQCRRCKMLVLSSSIENGQCPSCRRSSALASARPDGPVVRSHHE